MTDPDEGYTTTSYLTPVSTPMRDEALGRQSTAALVRMDRAEILGYGGGP
jgi:hypothetical protein